MKLPCLFALLVVAALPMPRAFSQTASPIAAALQPFVDSHTLAGAVTLVASKDKVLDMTTVGFADIAARKPMRADAVFWIASMSKPITATALMMLVDQGKVNVDDPVEKYLPEFKDQWLAVEQDAAHVLLKKPRHPITVKNALSHTSGLHFKSPLEQPTLDLLPLRVAVASHAMSPLQFEPDSKYQYSNAGINSAGRIIEVVSGMAYEEFLATRLFEPLGMKDTTFVLTDAQAARLAKAYKGNAAKTGLEETTITQLSYPLTDRKRQPMPGGGLFSTAADLANYCRMLLGGGVFEGRRYLSEAALRQMTSVQTGALPTSYGFGWQIDKPPATGYAHGGAYATNMRIDPEHGLALLYLVQHNGYPDREVGKKILPAFQKAARDAWVAGR